MGDVYGGAEECFEVWGDLGVGGGEVFDVCVGVVGGVLVGVCGVGCGGGGYFVVYDLGVVADFV